MRFLSMQGSFEGQYNQKAARTELKQIWRDRLPPLALIDPPFLEEQNYMLLKKTYDYSAHIGKQRDSMCAVPEL